MNRANYSDDGGCDGWQLIMWRGAVASAIRGKRGQAFLREMLSVLDAMPVKRLIPEQLIEGGEVCALGAVGRARGVPLLDKIVPEDYERLARVFGISQALVREIEYENDGGDYDFEVTPEQRWDRVRRWVEENIKP